MTPPFITFYTPTYRRPQALARCLASVQAQTAVEAIEQIVIPDHLGIGIGVMYRRVPSYAGVVHGSYVTFLCDDDVLASPTVVEQVRAFAVQQDYPPLILVGTEKGGQFWPADPPWPPRVGHIDLNCAIVRADVWKQHVYDYGNSYEGDYAFLRALHTGGVLATWCDVLFSTGAVSRGVPEAPGLVTA